MSQSYQRSLIKDNAIVIGGHTLIYMKGIIIMPIIIKSVGVTIYGGFVLLTSILGIAFGLSSLGAGFRAQRFMPSAKSMTERGELFYPQFYFNMFVILILSLLFVLMENQMNAYLFKNEISYSVCIIPLYLVFYLLYSKGSDYFRYTSRVHYMTLATLCFPYLDIGFILLYLYSCGPISINVLVISMAFASLLIAIPCFWVIFREIGAKFLFYKSSALIVDIKLGFPLVLGFIVDFILAGSDRYFIAFYLSVTDVGYYVPGYVLGSLIVFIPKAMGTALPQLLSRAVDSGNEAEAQQMLNYALKFFMLLAIPFIVGSMALGKPILMLLANEEIAEKAFWVTPVVALGTLFYGLNIILSNVLFVRMKTYALFTMNFYAAIFNLLANLILIYFIRNIIVAAITTLASYLVVFLYTNRIIKNEKFSIDFQLSVILKSLMATGVMCALLYWVSIKTGGHTSIALLAIEMILGIAVYAVGLFVLGAFSKKELAFVKGYVFS